MSELISGKEALIALANGDEVLWRTKTDAEIKCFKRQTPCLEAALSDCDYRFWIKPKTISINEIEVPAPFEPKEGERFYYFSDEYTTGYASSDGSGFYGDMRLGAWRTEDEIKQVVAALRSVFKTK